MRALDVVSSFAATLVRFGAGSRVGPIGERPSELLELFEFEACPYCRRVREALSILDLDALIHPCPKSGERFRPGLVSRAGKAQFPYLIDPNTGIEMYESAEIVRYLFQRYGVGRVPGLLDLGALTLATGSLASLLRFAKGTFAKPSRVAEQPLHLYGYEASPFCRLVRESLCVLELPYVAHNLARGSRRRASFEQSAGRMQVPFLEDPNTGERMFESAEINAYLDSTYALPSHGLAAP